MRNSIVLKCEKTPESVHHYISSKMKTLVVMACLIAISYAADPQILKSFYENYQNCLNEFNVPEWTPEVVRCIYNKYKIIDEQNVIIKEKLFSNYEKIISDQTRLTQAKEFFSICSDQVNEGPGSNEKKLNQIIICTLPVKDLLDKPQ